jgi:hypothetical protein
MYYPLSRLPNHAATIQPAYHPPPTIYLPQCRRDRLGRSVDLQRCRPEFRTIDRSQTCSRFR